MPSFITPARLAALVGVLTGLSAAVTSALNVIPHDTAVGRGVVAAVGVLGTIITVAKFLEGQASWEQQKSAQDHDVKLRAIDYGRAQPVIVGGKAHVLPVLHAPQNATPEPSIPEAVLPDESPLESVNQAGVIVDAEAASGEPQRLVDQAS